MKLLIKNWKEKRAEKKYQKECKKEELRFKKMCDEADRRHNLTGKRFFVVPKQNNELVIICNDDLKQHNKNSPKSNRISFAKLLEISYYSTSQGGLVRNLN